MITIFNRKELLITSLGIDLKKSYEYKIYVKKSDYERAISLVK